MGKKKSNLFVTAQIKVETFIIDLCYSIYFLSINILFRFLILFF